jgi:nitrogen fixation protein FixH
MSDDPAPKVGRSRSHWFWPGLILSLLGIQILLMLVMVFVATRDDSFSTEPDYYQKGLHWNETAAQLRENSRLGWTGALKVLDESKAGTDRIVELALRDVSGQPVDAASVVVLAFPHVRGQDRRTAGLKSVGGGRYRTPWRFDRQGVWEFRFTAYRGSDTFTQTIVREVFLTPDKQ